jgi:hypothetical protein
MSLGVGQDLYQLESRVVGVLRSTMGQLVGATGIDLEVFETVKFLLFNVYLIR